MKLKPYFAVILAALLLAALLCGCAERPAVSGRTDAEAQLITYLHDFVYEPDDAYRCEFVDEQERGGTTVYRFEAFWEENGEQYSLGIFSVSPDGTVAPDE